MLNLRELEGVLTRYPTNSIGILVADEFDFTVGARRWANTSAYNIILTNKKNICADLLSFTNESLNSNNDNR